MAVIEDKSRGFYPTDWEGKITLQDIIDTINSGGSATVTWDTLGGKPVVIAAGADQAAARAAIGAGTSNVKVGTGAADALAGNTVIPTAPTADTLSGATTVGKSVMKATDAAAARTAIGAGTSNVKVGTGAGDALAGNTTLLKVGTAATDAAAGNHNHAIAADTTSSMTAAANLQLAFNALAARIKALETAAAAG